MTACPLAKFGCTSELPYDNLLEHYSSRIHQEILLKAIESYVRELHSKTSDNSSQTNLENDDISEISESIDMLAEGLSCLQDDNIQIHTNFVQLLSNIMDQRNQIEQLKKSMEETTQMIHAVQVNNNILQTEVETMKRTLSDSSSVLSNNGSYIWKITDVASKFANAMNDQQTSIYSPPFYSSSTGYKMCMRLYLNGDGNARNTHISLFFVLMRGDYDAILKWPFEFKITFSLYDQAGTQRHIIDSFRPDIKSNSFQRPRSDMNIASGIPKFLPLKFIKEDNNPYVREDCMFIRCMVDFTSMPKMCIPYVINLNPGLPLSVQQNAIEMEIQKHNNISRSAGADDSSKKTDELKINKSE